jgi:enhancer of polycomb-like protein
LDIPVPRINLVRNYVLDIPADYKLPVSYIRYHRRTSDEWKVSLEYIADAEDEVWLKQNRFFTSTDGCIDRDGLSPQLSVTMFEHMMDIMDKETAFESIITMSQAEVYFQCRIPQLFALFPTIPRQVFVTTKNVIQEVYTYWVQKRSKLKRPLLRRFWPVTSTDDTNPHMVFRPREKEKYKLRKKRQNDFNAYRKMKHLREDFDNLRTVLDSVRLRESFHRIHVLLQVDIFQQRLYDTIDTSGIPRPSKFLCKNEVKKVLNNAPHYVDVNNVLGRKTSRATPNGLAHPIATSSIPYANDIDDSGASIGNTTGINVHVAGQNNGDPAPNFLQPLLTRESYATSWEGSVPHFPTYEDAQIQLTYRFRQRPRIGRGGRLCIDRVPLPMPQQLNLITDNVFTAGNGMHFSLEPKERLLDLLPKPLDPAAISRRIEALSVASMKEDFENRKFSAMAGEMEENDYEEVVVQLSDWLETDEQQWGDERYVIGPI